MFGFDKAFDVENCLSIYADDFVYIPASAIYDKSKIASLQSIINKCHIYMIGYMPKVDFVNAKQNGSELSLAYRVLNQIHEIKIPVPDGFALTTEEGVLYLVDKNNDRIWPDETQLQLALHHETQSVYFDVQYVGQAFGDAGSRNALDRLLKHETLQKIALSKVPENHDIYVLMLGIHEENRQITVFNPFAKNLSDGDARIEMGLQKLFNTSKEERVTLFEASLIRHFQPRFNNEFKNSFPSTNMKVLKDCYDKDFAAIVAEINFDNLPFDFRSDITDQTPHVIALHNLHKREDRDVFFGT